MYKVNYEERALKQLKKMDKFQATILVQWVNKNLVNTDDPRRFGKALTANHSGEWSYRIGDYRLLANIVDDVVTISILEVGHRRNIY